MNLELIRKEFLPDRTIGGLYIDGVFVYFTMEDTDRKLETGGIKIPKETCIPRGKYRVTLAWSQKHLGLVPLLLDVPQFTGIEIHVGNSPLDVEGCIAIGRTRNAVSHIIVESVLACSEFYPRLLQGIIESKDDVWITIS